MDKPVIILGGGIWGTLLAWRIHSVLPQVKFKLYEESGSLGNHQGFLFRQSECARAMLWIAPLISQSWDNYQIRTSANFKKFNDPVHLIENDKLNELLIEKLGTDIIKLNNSISPEIALQEAEFVIDARSNVHYKKRGFKKELTLVLELVNPHGIYHPVIFDSEVIKMESERNLQYYPLTEHRLLIKDIWYSDSGVLNIGGMREALKETLKSRGWIIKSIVREHGEVIELPMSKPVSRVEGKVLSLATIFHDLTGSSIPMATRLIDRMLKTSFRFGELKEVVTHFQKETEKDRKFFRYLNAKLILDKNARVLQTIYNQPQGIVSRFSRGKLSFIDRSRILVDHSWQDLFHAQSV